MKKIVFFDIDDVLFKTATFINSDLKKYENYKDAKTLGEFKNLADIAILSKGEYNPQLDKLKRTNLIDFFKKENIFVVKNKDEAITGIFEKFSDKIIFMVDDRLDNLGEIKKICPSVFAIWIKRGRYKNLAFNFKPDFTISSLSNIKKFL